MLSESVVPWWSAVLNGLVLLTGIILIFLVLIQRGKGGGLAGAMIPIVSPGRSRSGLIGMRRRVEG